MSNTIIKKIEIQHPTANVEVDIGAEAQSVTVSRNASGEIITNLDTEIVDSTETLAETLKNEEAPFTGATALTNGTKGLVPQPLAGDENKCLFGDATWRESISGSSITITSLESSLNGKQVSISDGTHTKTGTFDSSGICTITGITFVGNLTITSTDGTETATKIVNMPYFGVYATTLSFWAATVNITGDEELKGALVTVKNSSDVTVGTVTLSLVDATGVFVASEADTYSFNYSYGGDNYAEELEVTSQTTYSLSLSVGFNWKAWVTAGGLDPTDYANLNAVFADQVATRQLMLVHASADYLISAVTEDIDTIDDFCANDTAMKWIGLSDYVCDGLSAISGVWAKFLASTYWERILKDHVPTMTSNSAPYGSVSGSATSSGHDMYKLFDGQGTSTYTSLGTSVSSGARYGYKFTNPINVKSLKYRFGEGTTVSYSVNVRVEYSDDGLTWTATQTTITNNGSADAVANLDADYGYHLYWSIYLVSTSHGESTSWTSSTLQFYGRSLNVSVPVMSGNTVPYGAVSSSTLYSTYAAYTAFNGNDGDGGSFTPGGTNNYLRYEFPSPVCCKLFRIYFFNDTAAGGSFPTNRYIKIQGSNDANTWTDIASCLLTSGYQNSYVIANNTTRYKYYQLFCADPLHVYNNWCAYYRTLQFYGVDYSEKEFEAGTNRKWLYDHGLLLNGTTAINCTNDGECIVFNTSVRGALVKENIDITDNLVLRAKVPEGTADTSENKYICFIVRDFPVTQNLAEGLYSGIYLPNNSGLDVSTINQATQLSALNMGTPNSVKVSEWWLE